MRARPCSCLTSPPPQPAGTDARPAFPLTTSFVFSTELPLGARLCVCVRHDKRAVHCSAWLETAPAEERKGAFLKPSVWCPTTGEAHSANISQEVTHQLSLAFGGFRYNRSESPSMLSESPNMLSESPSMLFPFPTHPCVPRLPYTRMLPTHGLAFVASAESMNVDRLRERTGN